MTPRAQPDEARTVLMSGDFRRDEIAWDPTAEGDARILDTAPQEGEAVDSYKPYFEVLVVTPSDPANWERARDEMRRLRRPGSESPALAPALMART